MSDRKPKVLITGGSGLIGGLTIKHLGDKYEFTNLSRRPVEGVPSTQASITDYDAIRPAFDGVDMVLHLAAYVDDIEDWEGTMSITVGGTLNVFRAAQDAGIRRVVNMSTGSTMCGWEWYEGSPYGMLAAGRYDEVEPGWPMLDHTTPRGPTLRTKWAKSSPRRAAGGSLTNTECQFSTFGLAQCSTPTGQNCCGTSRAGWTSRMPCR